MEINYVFVFQLFIYNLAFVTFIVFLSIRRRCSVQFGRQQKRMLTPHHVRLQRKTVMTHGTCVRPNVVMKSFNMLRTKTLN